MRASDRVAAPNPSWSGDAPRSSRLKRAPFRIYNIGNGEPVPLLDYVSATEEATGSEAIREYLSHAAGDVPDTWPMSLTSSGRSAIARAFGPGRRARFVSGFRSYGAAQDIMVAGFDALPSARRRHASNSGRSRRAASETISMARVTA